MRNFIFFSFIALNACGPSLEDIEKMPEEERGKALYEKFCSQCHGDDGKMMSGVSDLSHSSLNDSMIVLTITNGRLEKGMPPHKDLLGTQENIVLLKDYIKTLRR